jgi:hypothetical protein
MPQRESALPRFGRRFLDPAARVTAIGTGSPGGKARGLLQLRDVLVARPSEGLPVDIPAMTVIGTDVFDRFMEDNRLWPVATGGAADAKIAMAFQAADLPIEIVGDLRALVDEAKTPLAVRSSSLLEDALEHPFAGVYATKMLPNDQPDADSRFRRLAEAIRLVYASTFFKAARSYLQAIDRGARDEKMAVIVQEVVGTRHGVRFYPDVSGVARSYAFYRTGGARPEDGVVSLALGLGKTIVDGGITWDYSPARPAAGAPFATASEILDGTQREFWAVSLGAMPRYDPISEIEYLVRGTLADAETDGPLRYVASTYDASSDRLYPGVRGDGARAVTFAPVLVGEALRLNDSIRQVLAASEAALEAPVEIEFACTFAPPRFGFVQVRPMAVSRQPVEVDFSPADPSCIVASDAVLGNGDNAGVSDIVFVRRDRFDPAASRAIAADIGELNAALVAQRRPYLLIGFGRWGSSDPWLGIPVDWTSITGAKAIVETMLPSRRVEPSQGSHFFHNIASFGVLYFTVRPDVDPPIRWEWIERQPMVGGTSFVAHARTAQPLRIAVDGRSGRGVIRSGEEIGQ